MSRTTDTSLKRKKSSVEEINTPFTRRSSSIEEVLTLLRRSRSSVAGDTAQTHIYSHFIIAYEWIVRDREIG